MRTFLATLALAALASARPDSQYGAPEAAPASSYDAPAESYGAPAESYGAPAESYSAPSYGAPAGGLDLTTLIIPILALVGLFLLFPTYVTLTSVRRKREVGAEDESLNLVDRIQDMYMAIVESEECIERVACQVGALAQQAGIDGKLSAMAMMMAPAKYTKYVKQFAMPSHCEKIKCGNMF